MSKKLKTLIIIVTGVMLLTGCSKSAETPSLKPVGVETIIVEDIIIEDVITEKTWENSCTYWD